MTQPTLFVCALCQSLPKEPGFTERVEGQYLIDQLQRHLDTDDGACPISLQPVRCMAACASGCNAALAAPGKLTFIFRDLSPLTAAPELLEFCRQYAAVESGKVPYSLRSAPIKQATAYVLPALSSQPSTAQ